MSGPTAPGNRLQLPKPRPELLLRGLVAFVAALGIWYLLRYPYGEALVFSSDRILRVVEGVDGAVLREGDRGLELVTRLVRPEGGPPKTLRVERQSVHEAHWNLILFLTVVLVTPPGRLRERWRRLLSACLILVLYHVAFLASALFLRLEAAYAGVGLPRYGDTTMYVVAGGFLLSQTVLAPLLPFALIAPVWLGRRRASGER